MADERVEAVMSRFAFIQKHIFIILLAMIVGLLVQDVYVSTFHINREKECENLYPAYISGVLGLEIGDSDIYHTKTNDPQIEMRFPIRQFNRVKIHLSQPALQSMNVCVYYASEGQSFAQERCVGQNCKANQVVVLINIPAGYYDKIRVDIGNQEGLSYSLNAIVISEVVPAFSWAAFISVSVIVFLFLFQKRGWFEKRILRHSYFSVLVDVVFVGIIILQIGAMPVSRYLLIGVMVASICEEAGFLFGHWTKETDA